MTRGATPVPPTTRGAAARPPGNEPRPADPQRPEADQANGNTGANAGTGGAGDASPAEASAERSPASRAQLYRQCESAARRGDCAAVRRIVGQITRTDRGYRARIAKDAAVAKCLAE